jgi:hypothetical protein
VSTKKGILSAFDSIKKGRMGNVYLNAFTVVPLSLQKNEIVMVRCTVRVTGTYGTVPYPLEDISSDRMYSNTDTFSNGTTVGISLTSVVDRHRFDADPDPNFHVDADPDPDPVWHIMIPILMRILLQVSHMLGKSQLCQFTCLSFSSVSKMS